MKLARLLCVPPLKEMCTPLVARVAADAPKRVRSLTLIEPVLFHLLAPAGKVNEHEEIRAVADRAIQFAEAGNPEEAARGFIEYWVQRNGQAARGISDWI